jgi:thiol-disulfide isomerase/thioredoxin
MLENMKETMSNLLLNKKFLIILVVSAIFIALAIYLYITYVKPRMLEKEYVPNKEIEYEKEKEAELYYFYTTWCPYCKKAKPEWEKLKETYNEKLINNTKVHFKEIDCDKDSKTADEFNVEGYPTIKLIKTNGDIVEYDAKPEYSTLNEFLHTTL